MRGHFRQSLRALLIKHRRILIIILHAFLAVGSNYLAYLVLFEDAVPSHFMDLFWRILPWLLVIRLVSFAPFHLYQGMWRYTSVADLASIAAAATLSTILVLLWLSFGLGLRGLTSIYLVDTSVLILAMGGLRTLRVVYYGLERGDRRKRVVIFGAGDIGATVVREMKDGRKSGYRAVGLIDDDEAKRGRWIHGVKIFGPSSELARVVENERADILLLASPSLSAARLREIVQRIEPFQIVLKILPRFEDLADSSMQVERMRNVSLSDLLARQPVDLDSAPLNQLINNKRVLVTGAGGSIGSELSRQVAGLNPGHLILFDRYENALFDIENDLLARGHHERLTAAIGDISDEGRLDQIFREFAPQVIFHAAAHKHVPLMEREVCEAVKNNVRGTRLLAEAARKYCSELMMLISTDKAVNPASIMGATKRAAETMIQVLWKGAETKFATVRFGNVLGSNGSVLPQFMKQIAKGGPVKITHPEMRRFFMLIPEAVQLVLHAATIAESGAVYMLEMGEQIKVLDLARNLIKLAGFTPDKDISIEFIGLRPGEKLFEELIGPGEKSEPSSVPGVLLITSRAIVDANEAKKQIDALETAALRNDSAGASRLLMDFVTNHREPVNNVRCDHYGSHPLAPIIYHPKFPEGKKSKLPLPASERSQKQRRTWQN
jgi:FlaA1/EpsC-like NDP-sugar epimerase